MNEPIKLTEAYMSIELKTIGWNLKNFNHIGLLDQGSKPMVIDCTIIDIINNAHRWKSALNAGSILK